MSMLSEKALGTFRGKDVELDIGFLRVTRLLKESETYFTTGKMKVVHVEPN